MAWGRAVLTAVAAALWATGAAAQSYQECKAKQRDVIEEVLPRAEEMAMRASASIGDTEIYGHWFGTYVPKFAEGVRPHFKRIHRALSGDEVVYICGRQNSADCNGVYAYVYSSEPYNVTLCPDFFDMRQMPGGSAKDPAYENGTMAGTLIHEISHFDVVGATEDHCYSRTDCGRMGARSPQEAVENVDTYQYFAEDVTFAFLAAEEGLQTSAETTTPTKP